MLTSLRNISKKHMQGSLLMSDSISSVYGTNDFYNAYNPYGVSVAEVEVDVLTGETEVLRVDILYDCGQR